MDSSFDSSVGLRAPPAEMALWQTTPALLHAGFGCDPDVAVAALVTGPAGRYYAVDAHGGGETALALVSRGAQAVVVVPLLDPEGAACVIGLKIAALRHLDREDYLRFIGLRRSARARRVAAYGLLRGALSPTLRAFWDRHEDVLARGLFVNEADVAQGRLLRNLLRTHLSKAGLPDPPVRRSPPAHRRVRAVHRGPQVLGERAAHVCHARPVPHLRRGRGQPLDLHRADGRSAPPGRGRPRGLPRVGARVRQRRRRRGRPALAPERPGVPRAAAQPGRPSGGARSVVAP